MDFMESSALRSANCGVKTEEIGIESFQFAEELQRLTYVRPENGSSFTALLKLPANQAMELICSPEREVTPAMFSREVWVNNPNVEDRQPYHLIPMVRANTSLGEGASNFSVFASAGTSPGTISIPHEVKHEPLDSDSIRNSSSAGDEPMYLDRNQKLTKRKEREKKVNPLAKKSKNASNATSADGEKLPYVHVRARRGQATDSHSLAERARREKINARMKLLKELVPGANKISGTALVLDEIINHVQFLQSQVEFLSMRLAAVNSRIDFNLDGLLAAESLQAQGRCPTDSNYPGVAMPSVWPEQLNGNCQPPCYTDGIHQPVWRMKQDSPNFVAPDNSLLIYDEILNSASLQLNQLKMEL